MPTHTILGADGRPVRRWREVRSERFRLMRSDGTLVTVGGGVVMREDLPLDEWKPCVPPPCPPVHEVTWNMDLTDAWRHVLGLGPILTPAQTRGAVPLDPNHTGPDLETPT